MQKDVIFNKKIVLLSQRAELECAKEFKKIDELCELNSFKVLQAFRENNVSEIHFNSTTGYGYNDIGREVIEKVFSVIRTNPDVTTFVGDRLAIVVVCV